MSSVTIADTFKQTRIWEKFEGKANNTNKSNVEFLVKYAQAISSRIVDTFPTYTLHDGQHQLNVLNRMTFFNIFWNREVKNDVISSQIG